MNILFTIADASVKLPNFRLINGLKMYDIFFNFLEKKTTLTCFVAIKIFELE